MSHYVVFVIGDQVEKQLAPYNENIEDPALLKFNDIEDEYTEKFAKEMTVWLAPDGVAHYADRNKKLPSGYQEVTKPGPEIFGSFERYMDEWCGEKGRDPKTGRYGYWRNPNSKWDWYQEGGRWAGFLPLRSGKTGDSALKCEIDFERARKEAADEAVSHWDEVHAVVAGREWPPSWTEVLTRHGEANVEAARTEYNNHPVLKDLFDLRIYPSESDLAALQLSREAYAQKARDGAIVPYAVVRDGQWFARGEMGWFGMSSDLKEDNTWQSEVSKLFDSLPDDTRITVIDCHI